MDSRAALSPSCASTATCATCPFETVAFGGTSLEVAATRSDVTDGVTNGAAPTRSPCALTSSSRSSLPPLPESIEPLPESIEPLPESMPPLPESIEAPLPESIFSSGGDSLLLSPSSGSSGAAMGDPTTTCTSSMGSLMSSLMGSSVSSLMGSLMRSLMGSSMGSLMSSLMGSLISDATSEGVAATSTDVSTGTS